jgi:hypothetical protein
MCKVMVAAQVEEACPRRNIASPRASSFLSRMLCFLDSNGFLSVGRDAKFKIKVAEDPQRVGKNQRETWIGGGGL